jgi:hypothetical protein
MSCDNDCLCSQEGVPCIKSELADSEWNEKNHQNNNSIQHHNKLENTSALVLEYQQLTSAPNPTPQSRSFNSHISYFPVSSWPPYRRLYKPIKSNLWFKKSSHFPDCQNLKTFIDGIDFWTPCSFFQRLISTCVFRQSRESWDFWNVHNCKIYSQSLVFSPLFINWDIYL